MLLYLLIPLISAASFAFDIQYRIPGYYNKVHQINDQALHTGGYISSASQTSTTITTTTQEDSINNANQLQKNRSFMAREDANYSPYKSYTKAEKREPRFSVLGHLGIGGQYLFAPSVDYTTVTGATTNVLGHAHTYAIVPIGLEFAFNANQKNTLSFGGTYYLNPFRDLVENTYNNQKVFEGFTNYMIYGKYAYRFQKSLSVYILGGVTNFKINVMNDINNTVFIEANTFSPSVGAGILFHINGNTAIFLDGIYSFIGKLDSVPTSDRRLTAISQRSYGGVQARVGISYNFTRAFF